MKVINQKHELITDYDQTTGHLINTKIIKEDATPIDNITKFAWDEADYEDVKMYVPNRVKTTAEQISELKGKLASTDYKVIKCSECQILGQEMPYDVTELHAERQAIRDQINNLQSQI